MDKEIINALGNMIILTWIFMGMGIFIIYMIISSMKDDLKGFIRYDTRDFIRDENRDLKSKLNDIERNIWKK